MFRQLVFILTLTIPVFVQSADSIFVAEAKGDFDKVYQSVYKSLEENKFFVVFEPDIGDNLSRFGKNWGDDYNRNKLERIKSMVFCNGWYANKVSNADPDMLALCPLHITLTHKNGITKVLFVRPDSVAKGTKAEAVANEIAEGVIDAIKKALAIGK